MRGFIACSIIAEYERATGKPCAAQFDLIAGTSVGGIIAALLSIGVPAKDALAFFTVDGPAIFKPRWWTLWGLLAPKYGPDEIERGLQSRLGLKPMSAALTRLLLTSVDARTGDGYFFKSYKCGNSDDGKPDDYMWQACRATSAANTYFPPYKLDNLLLFDGGNIAINPATCALADAVALWGLGEHIRILSVGCGMDQSHIAGDELENAGAIRVALATIKLLFEADSAETDYLLGLVCGKDYCRYQPSLDEPLGMDDATPAGIAKLEKAAVKAVLGFKPTLQAFLAE